ncbi:MAG: plasmid stabilization protein [Desulfobacterales bacterium]|nr:plasmid stabilization protein [Desulfobacterales bacterium]
MASLTLRNIDDSLKTKLRISAAANNRSMEEEARQILKYHLLRQKSTRSIGTRIAGRFAEAGGVDLSNPERSYPREAPDFGSNNRK